MDKRVIKYSKIFTSELKAQGYDGVQRRKALFENRLTEMYSSDVYKEHSIYPTMNTDLIYGVIAMCLELKDLGMPDDGIIDFMDGAFRKRKKIVALLAGIIDQLPNTYRIVEKWNLKDHENRVKDGSITYDIFDVQPGRIEYSISGCMYVNIFEYYGIRRLCRIFCNTDINAYDRLTKHVRFTRYSDLSDGCSCHDVITDKGREK